MPVLTDIRFCYPETADPLPNRGIEFRGFTALVDTVAAAGANPPAEFIAVRDRFNALRSSVLDGGRTMFGRVVDAVITGDGDAETLFAAALAERDYDERANVLADMDAQIGGRLRDLYATAAHANYTQIREQFDHAAKGFESCAHILDPGADAETAANASSRRLAAWREAPAWAAELDRLVEPLCAAAELVRRMDLPSGLGSDTTPFLLPLCADITGIDRREAWSAWNDAPPPKPAKNVLTVEDLVAPPEQHEPTRGGRWTRLFRLGAVIGAAENPTEVDMYGRPKELVVDCEIRGGRPRGVAVDPNVPGESPRRRRSQGGPLARLAGLARRHGIPADDVPAELNEPSPVDGVADADPEAEIERLVEDDWGK